jgi:hypothetical protein
MAIRNDWGDTVTAQEIFDHAVTHMREQTERCVAARDDGYPPKCAYRSDDRKGACALGALLSDVEAAAIVGARKNNATARELADASLLPQRLAAHLELICRLQSVHDDYSVRPLARTAEHDLTEIAKHHGLTYTPPAR